MFPLAQNCLVWHSNRDRLLSLELDLESLEIPHELGTFPARAALLLSFAVQAD